MKPPTDTLNQFNILVDDEHCHPLMTMLQVSSLWSWVIPAIRQALTQVSPETIRDWGTSFATSCDARDPNR